MCQRGISSSHIHIFYTVRVNWDLREIFKWYSVHIVPPSRTPVTMYEKCPKRPVKVFKTHIPNVSQSVKMLRCWILIRQPARRSQLNLTLAPPPWVPRKHMPENIKIIKDIRNDSVPYVWSKFNYTRNVILKYKWQAKERSSILYGEFWMSFSTNPTSSNNVTCHISNTWKSLCLGTRLRPNLSYHVCVRCSSPYLPTV